MTDNPGTKSCGATSRTNVNVANDQKAKPADGASSSRPGASSSRPMEGASASVRHQPRAGFESMCWSRRRLDATHPNGPVEDGDVSKAAGFKPAENLGIDVLPLVLRG